MLGTDFLTKWYSEERRLNPDETSESIAIRGQRILMGRETSTLSIPSVGDPNIYITPSLGSEEDIRNWLALCLSRTINVTLNMDEWERCKGWGGETDYCFWMSLPNE